MTTLFSLFVAASLTFAQGIFQRQASLEWGAIPGATEYELELTPLQGPAPKATVLVLKEPRWSGQIAPGKYTYRIRIRNARGQTSGWTPANELVVKLGKIEALAPSADETLQATGSDDSDVLFQWQPMPGAKDYLLTYDGLPSGPVSVVVPTNVFKTRLPAGTVYTWKVLAQGPGLQADEMASLKFTIQARQLDRPQIIPPSTSFVRELKWTEPDGAQSYESHVYIWLAKISKWQKRAGPIASTTPNLNFDPQWPGGQYRVQVFAQSQRRPKSAPGDLRFTVHNGDRSVEAEKLAGQAGKLDKKKYTPWTLSAGYMASNVAYDGSNAEVGNSSLSYSTLAGSGYIGIAKIPARSRHGFAADLELASLVVGEKNTPYNSLTLSGIYRVKPNFRIYYGLGYREIPETIYDSVNNLYATNLIKFIGPEFQMSWRPRLGLRGHFTILYPFLKQQTPNSQDLVPEPSFELGGGYSFRMQNTLNLYVGYSYRATGISYKAIDSTKSIDSFAEPGAVNKVKMTGHFLGLIAEWGF